MDTHRLIRKSKSISVKSKVMHKRTKRNNALTKEERKLRACVLVFMLEWTELILMESEQCMLLIKS